MFFSSKTCACHFDEVIADFEPPNSTFLCSKEAKKPITKPFTFVDMFSEKTGSDFLDRLLAVVPLSTEVETGIFVISMNIGTGQSTSQLWNFSSVYIKKMDDCERLFVFVSPPQ